jgi:hypothetical protein
MVGHSPPFFRSGPGVTAATTMSITISGQYVFRGKARDDSEPVGIIYPDTTRGRVFAPTPGESFTELELSEISELVKKMAFSHHRRNRVR